MMNEYRLKPLNFCMADAMPFQQHHEGRIAGRDLNDPEILTDHLLVDLRSNVKPGDQVVICGYQDQTWQRLTQFVTLRVVATDAKSVRFVKTSEIVSVPITEDDPAPAPVEDKVHVRRGYQCFNVVDKDENVLETFKTKPEATSFAKNVNTG